MIVFLFIVGWILSGIVPLYYSAKYSDCDVTIKELTGGLIFGAIVGPLAGILVGVFAIMDWMEANKEFWDRKIFTRKEDK